MTDYSDKQLLNVYLNQRSEQAFEILMHRFSGLVYAAANRKTRDHALAEEVTQLVFLDLAKNAAKLRQRESIAPWLHQAAYYQASKAIRSEVRRRNREGHYATDFSRLEEDSAPSSWTQLKPLLDQGIQELPLKDREIVIWRYLENQPYSEIARRSNLTEAATRKRLQRALAKLSEYFQKHSITVVVTALATILSRQNLSAAPVNLILWVPDTTLPPSPAEPVQSVTKKLCYGTLALGSLGMIVFTLKKNTSELSPLTSSTQLIASLALQQEELTENPPPLVAAGDASSLFEDVAISAEPSPEPEAEKPWWLELKSDDPATFIANCAQAGFPSEIIEDLLFTELLIEHFREAINPDHFSAEELAAKVSLPEKLFGLWQTFQSQPDLDLHEQLMLGAMPSELAIALIDGIQKRALAQQEEEETDSQQIVVEHQKIEATPPLTEFEPRPSISAQVVDEQPLFIEEEPEPIPIQTAGSYSVLPEASSVSASPVEQSPAPGIEQADFVSERIEIIEAPNQIVFLPLVEETPPPATPSPAIVSSASPEPEEAASEPTPVTLAAISEPLEILDPLSETTIDLDLEVHEYRDDPYAYLLVETKAFSDDTDTLESILLETIPYLPEQDQLTIFNAEYEFLARIHEGEFDQASSDPAAFYLMRSMENSHLEAALSPDSYHQYHEHMRPTVLSFMEDLVFYDFGESLFIF